MNSLLQARWFSAGAVKAARYSRRRSRSGFTLIEVLVVVAIIALLLSVLLPSLSRAKESARSVKCMSNLSNLSKAALSFAVDYRGQAQLIAREQEWRIIDPSYTRYDYQQGGFGTSTRQLKAWPVAYARHLGIRALRSNEQYADLTYVDDPAYYFQRFGRQEVFTCPSDKILVHNLWSPVEVYGIISYAANEDICGVTEPQGANLDGAGEGQPWANGASGDKSWPPRAKRLEGRMDKIFRPSDVALFSDGGNEDLKKNPLLLLTNAPPGGGQIHGPYLENYEKAWGRLPHFRHGDKGGLAVAIADGSGRFVRPAEWVSIGTRQFVKRYLPRVRISPYAVGTLSTTQP